MNKPIIKFWLNEQLKLEVLFNSVSNDEILKQTVQTLIHELENTKIIAKINISDYLNKAQFKDSSKNIKIESLSETAKHVETPLIKKLEFLTKTKNEINLEKTNKKLSENGEKTTSVKDKQSIVKSKANLEVKKAKTGQDIKVNNEKMKKKSWKSLPLRKIFNCTNLLFIIILK